MKKLKLQSGIIRKVLLTAVACCTIFACTEETETNSEAPGAEDNGRRTVLVYMNARNSLYGNVKQDSLEMVRGAQNMDDRDRILLYVCKDRNSYLYRISKQGTKLLLQGDYKQNASDPKQLEAILKWTAEQFPSEEYGLVMWSHSDGWLPSTTVTEGKSRSFGVDVGANGNPWTDRLPNGQLGYQMNITDLAQAVTASGMRPKFVFFDSCLMNGIEAMYALRHTTDWIIASPAQIPGVGAQYTRMMEEVFYTIPFNPQAFTASYVKQASTYPEYGNMGVVLSAVKTENLENLAQVTRNLLAKYDSDKEPDMSRVLAYDRYAYRSFYRPEFFDLKQAMCRIITNETDREQWLDALEACVLYPDATPTINMWSNFSTDNLILNPGEFSAISAFVPQQKYSDYAEDCIFGDLNRAFMQTEWAKASGWNENTYLKSLLTEQQ